MTRDADPLAPFAITQVPAEARISGFVAIVVQPDAATIRASYELASALMPESAEHPRAGSSFEARPHPHVMTAERVVLAKMGALGRVEHVLSLAAR